MRFPRRPRREVRRDGPAESLRGCSRVPMEGAYARQGRCRAAPAGPSLPNPDRRIRLWSQRSAVGAVGSRRPATGVRNNQRVPSETVEDHDRRSLASMAADLAFLTRLHDPQLHAVPCVKTRCRSRTEEARGSNPLTSTPQHCRSERRRLRAGGAHCSLRPQHGRKLKSQSSPGGSQRPGDSALAQHDDHGA
jgi:hypothetical protein